MPLSDNPFLGLPLQELQNLQATYIQVLTDLAQGGQSYSFPGRSFTRVNLTEVRKLLTDVRMAIGVAGGTIIQFVNARVNTQMQFDTTTDVTRW